MKFDPALVRWSFKEATYGRSLALHYGTDDLRFQDSCAFGARPKFPLPEYGVMIKAVINDRRWFNPRCRDQCHGDAVVWSAVPDHLRSLVQPTICVAGASLDETRFVNWSAQEWCPGTDDVTVEEGRAIYAQFRAANFFTVDEAPMQFRRRPDGSVVCLDYGSWYIPGEDPGMR